MVVCLATSVASAEGVGPRSDGGPARIQGVTTMLPTPGGLVTIGGPALRRLAPGARRWETLHTIAGDNLYRVDGRFQPQLLYREEHAHRIFDSKRGSLFAFPKHIGQECDHLTCFPITEIVAYEITDAGIRRQTVLRGDGWGPGFYLAGATAVRGSDDERVAMVVDFTKNDGKYWRGGGRGIVRWRWGQGGGEYRPLPGNTSTTPKWLLTRNDDFIELVEHWETRPDRLEIKRYLAGGGEQSTMLTALMKMASPYGLGERAGTAGLWLQWGEHIALLPPHEAPRSVDLDPLVQRGFEWAGAHAYVSSPESIWVGLDGRGRSYARVDLGNAQRRSKPWP